MKLIDAAKLAERQLTYGKSDDLMKQSKFDDPVRRAKERDEKKKQSMKRMYGIGAMNKKLYGRERRY